MKSSSASFQGIVAIVMVVSSPVARAEEKQLAAGILEATGVRQGLCVHVGCGEGKLTAELARDGKLLVQGLTPDKKSFVQARETIQSQGLYGQASVIHGHLSRLPYIDNLVNLVVVHNLPELLKVGCSLEEMMRVVRPTGIALIGQSSNAGGGKLSEGQLKSELAKAGIKDFDLVKEDGLWVKIRKPRPAGMGEWTHTEHGADGNPVSKDTLLGRADALQWTAGPPYDVYRDQFKNMLSASGRSFYLTKESRETFSIIARDSFNGLLLWKRTWSEGFRKSQKKLPGARKLRMTYDARITANGDRVYALTPGRVLALSAMTGETIRDYDAGDDPGGFGVVCAGKTLLIPTAKGLVALEEETGKLLWRQGRVITDDPVVDGEAVFCLDVTKLPPEAVSLDLGSGKVRWRNSDPPWTAAESDYRKRRFVWMGFASGDLVAVVGNRGVYALSAKDGKSLWSRRSVAGRSVYVRVYLTNGLVWVFDSTLLSRERNSLRGWTGFDPKTGVTMERFQNSRRNDSPTGYLGLCVRAVATERMLLGGSLGYFFDTMTTYQFPAIRGKCGVGTLPANGLVYAAPSGCNCDYAWLVGLVALSGVDKSMETGRASLSERFEKGKAFGTRNAERGTRNDNWVTYRHDYLRSGSTPVSIPAGLKQEWAAPLGKALKDGLGHDWNENAIWGGVISSPTAADGRVFVSLPDMHQVVALDAKTGKELWRYAAGARVVAPPSLWQGLCLFGSQDGWAYAVRASDGVLVWRFRAHAHPRERFTVAFGQVESAWPVFGGVLIDKGIAYMASGRSSDLDGGIRVCAVKADTGQLVWERAMRGYKGLNDVPALDQYGYFYFPGSPTWDLHLDTKRETPSEEALKSKSNEFPPRVFTSDEIFPLGHLRCRITSNPGHHAMKRTSLLNGACLRAGTPLPRESRGWNYRGSASGDLLAFDQKRVCGYQIARNPKLFAKAIDGMKDYGPFLKNRRKLVDKGAGEVGWTLNINAPRQMQAMIMAGDTVVVGGPLDRGNQGEGELWLMSAEDGTKLQTIKLDWTPVYEGLAAAYGKVFVSTVDGKLLCFGK